MEKEVLKEFLGKRTIILVERTGADLARDRRFGIITTLNEESFKAIDAHGRSMVFSYDSVCSIMEMSSNQARRFDNIRLGRPE